MILPNDYAERVYSGDLEKLIVVSFGYIGVFSALLEVTMWQWNVIEQAR